MLFKQNKKQRLVVREAVLRSKDPEVILQELEELEKTGKFIIIGSFQFA